MLELAIVSFMMIILFYLFSWDRLIALVLILWLCFGGLYLIGYIIGQGIKAASG